MFDIDSRHHVYRTDLGEFSCHCHINERFFSQGNGEGGSEIGEQMVPSDNLTWLVGGLEHGFNFSIQLGMSSFSWECHHPNWRSHVFQRGSNHQPDDYGQWNMLFLFSIADYQRVQCTALSMPKWHHRRPWLTHVFSVESLDPWPQRKNMETG